MTLGGHLCVTTSEAHVKLVQSWSVLRHLMVCDSIMRNLQREAGNTAALAFVFIKHSVYTAYLFGVLCSLL